MMTTLRISTGKFTCISEGQSWLYGSCIYNYLCNQWLSALMLWNTYSIYVFVCRVNDCCKTKWPIIQLHHGENKLHHGENKLNHGESYTVLISFSQISCYRLLNLESLSQTDYLYT
jgi:hypothetical protein